MHVRLLETPKRDFPLILVSIHRLACRKLFSGECPTGRRTEASWKLQQVPSSLKRHFTLKNWNRLFPFWDCDSFQALLTSSIFALLLQISGSVHSEYSTSPGELIIFSVDRYGGNQVVMGSRGLGILRRSILGSVSQYVIEHSRVPVTIIPRESVKNWFI